MRIILIGSSGAMGTTISRIANADPKTQIMAGLQSSHQTAESYPVFTQAEDLQAYVEGLEEKIDLIIDFSSPVLTEKVLQLAIQLNLPLLLATTGQSSLEIERIQEASRRVPILYTHNTSLGIAVFIETLKQITKVLYPQGYDIEVIEHHHRYKQDAPSGTALMLRNAIEEVIHDELQIVYGRQGKSDGRPQSEIAIHAIRAGDIVGEHQVIFAGHQEEIILTHKAQSKDLFAKGALKCGELLLGQAPGLYTIQDLI